MQVEKLVGIELLISFSWEWVSLHNYFSVINAAHMLHHPDAFNIGIKRITISTAGVITGIESICR